MGPHLNASQSARYLARQMAPGELLKADEHLASCVTCREALEAQLPRWRPAVAEHLTYEELVEALEGRAAAAAVSHLEGCPLCAGDLEDLRETASRDRVLAFRASRPRRMWLWAVAAAAIVLLILALPKRPTPPPPAPTVAKAPTPPPLLALNEIQPPPYSAEEFRGNGGTGLAPFRQAMAPYQRADWRGAEEALGRVVQQYPGAFHAVYFRAICQLLYGDTAAAIAGLDRVIALGGATPYEEEARFYRAQALLVSGQREDALTELRRVVDLHGDYEAKAGALIARL